MSLGFGTQSSQQQSNSQGQSLPINLQNPAYVGMSPGVANGLAALFQGGPSGFTMPGANSTAGLNPSAAYASPLGAMSGTGGTSGSTDPMASAFSAMAPGAAGSGFMASPNAYQPFGSAGGFFSPFMVGGQASNGANNSLVAPVTASQQATLNNIGNTSNPANFGMPGAQLAGVMQPYTSGQGYGGMNPVAANMLTNFMNPNFASNLATSPQTQAAIASAVNPITQAFRTQTAPALSGAATAAGQRTGGPGQAGSSAFDQAFATAAGNEQAAIGQTAGGIANNAYQTGLGITANVPSQAITAGTAVQGQQLGGATAPTQLTSAQVNELIQTLQSQVLPQLTQQYGINQGLQLFQSQIGYILQALGLGGQISQPALAMASESSGSGSGSSSGFGVNAGIGNAFGAYGGSG